jgi:hypothetical protein
MYRRRGAPARRLTPLPYYGSCFCAYVTYAIDVEPLYACHCHCHSCQQAAGAPFVTWATFPAAAFRIAEGVIAEYRSSPGVTRGFCAQCGTSLTYTNEDRPGEIDITVASLAEPQRIVPRSHIWVENKAPWLVIDDGLPQYQRKATP